ncbi:n/a [Ectocarpus siliculosus]|uniref:N/a n=1 Tax=Ectocarpus siliculosus TaxID=2880 RepID=D7G9I4_ECTSI|nr:n/a [Ectocarpus siliculosus]|eukprot:CBJ34094.1 n/a [Ectocarpus siliculosus]
MEAASPRKAANEPYNSNHIPVFLDRTFSFIEDTSPDIVCWSEVGDSFIVKKVLAFEGLLPSYYNHKKFLSFVRQLNFYGFKKVRGRGASSRASSASSSAQGEAAEAEESASWEEFKHPQFRRGRRDLLVGIKRQKDDGRMKRRQEVGCPGQPHGRGGYAERRLEGGQRQAGRYCVAPVRHG